MNLELPGLARAFVRYADIDVLGTAANTVMAPQQTMPTSQANDRTTG